MVEADAFQRFTRAGFIIPNTLLTGTTYQSFRERLLSKTNIETVVDIETTVFTGVETGGVTIPIIQNHPTPRDNVIDIEKIDNKRQIESVGSIEQTSVTEIPESRLVTTPAKVDLLHRIPQNKAVLEDCATFYQGIITGDNSEYISSDKETESHEKVVRGRDVDEYLINWGGSYVLFDEDKLWSNTDRERFEKHPKIIIRQTSDSLISAVDEEGVYSLDSTLLIYTDELEEKYVSALLNSKVLNWYYQAIVPEQGEAFSQVKITNLSELPVADTNNSEIEEIGEKYETIRADKEAKAQLNLTLRDHLGSYSDGQTLADVGLTQPPKGSADSVLQQTTEEKPNLRVGKASVERESPNTVVIRLTARYKPDDEDDHETDQWGYTETEPLTALRITDLTETEADLIEVFVPVAVDEAGGFANFRETATKTNSLVDRLRRLTLPAADDVRAGLESYTETVERAEELEAKIERTDERIDEIVYELYGLTDEEIEIVEETVAD